MEKVTIEVEIPENLDLQHCLRSVSDALYLPDNVTQAEYDFVTKIIGQVFIAKDDLINKTTEEVVAEQVKLINHIQETANLNIINCCKCGSTMIHDRTAERIKCICGEIVYTQDCEDLWYEGCCEDLWYEGFYYPKSEEQTKQK